MRDDQVIGMPSHAVDEAWHGLILCTARYAAFCDRAYGRFLHHHPEGGAPSGRAHGFTRRAAAQDGHRVVDGGATAVSSVCCGTSTDGSAWTIPGALISPGSTAIEADVTKLSASGRNR